MGSRMLKTDLDTALVIRQYRPEDREQVREISCDTADGGKPVERLLHDRRTVADWLTNYYVEHEPQSLWVARSDEIIAGYLTGCLDTRKCGRVMKREVLPKVIAGALARGALWHAEAWRLLLGFLATALLGGVPTVDLERYPAHLHINLRQGFRGRKIGARLVDHFRRQVVEAGGAGIHVMTLGHNAAGRRFFEAMAFRLLHEQPLLLPEGGWYRKTSTAFYGWTKES
jgi:ribosomal protein S18 acetylase RimI-like enzyme